MPQLETTHIFMFLMWTWLTLYLMMKKINSLSMIKAPKYQSRKNNKTHNMEMPWT